MSGSSMPATHAEIKQGCPGATADFILECLDLGATLPEAQTAWMIKQNQSLEEEKAARQRAESRSRNPGSARMLGNGKRTKGKLDDDGKPCEDDDDEDGDETDSYADPVGSFNSLVRKETKANGGDRRRATVTVCKRYPALHEQFLIATNSRSVRGKIRDRFNLE